MLCHGSGLTPTASAAGVTLITHGWNGNVTDWVIPMAAKIAQYRSFPGTNVSLYQVSITRPGGVYQVTPEFLDGDPPMTSDSGEILVVLDWSSLSGGSVPTTAIAAQAAAALLTNNLHADFQGHALAELPLHLVGHSRGASVVIEMARMLGTNGVWVDQVTMLDPYPVSLFGDPSIAIYQNILFVDNYWQGMTFPGGQNYSGAYNRQLTNLDNGYASAHSDVHFWYHGTIDLTNYIFLDGAALTAAERATWWTAVEAAGTNAGFLYSLIGGGNRFSSLEPAGAGKGRISDGINKAWDLGGGLAANRTALSANTCAWPNIIRLNRTATNALAAGQPIPLILYYQAGSNASASASLRISLDPDLNPYNNNAIEVLQAALTGTSRSNVFYTTPSPVPSVSAVWPGTYWISGRITTSGKTRYFYAPETLALTPSAQAPALAEPRVTGGFFGASVLGTPGQTIVVEGSANLRNWIPILTNTLAGTATNFTDVESPALPQRYYRASLRQ